MARAVHRAHAGRRHARADVGPYRAERRGLEPRRTRSGSLRSEPDPRVATGPRVTTDSRVPPGSVGVITPMTHTYCASCNRVRLTADGRLRTCLFGDHEVDLRGPLRAGEPLEPAFRAALADKPLEHALLQMRVGGCARSRKLVDDRINFAHGEQNYCGRRRQRRRHDRATHRRKATRASASSWSTSPRAFPRAKRSTSTSRRRSRDSTLASSAPTTTPIPRAPTVVVITAGIARKPGMSRDDLLATNAGIVRQVSESIKATSPDAIIIMVSNPLDVMCYVAKKVTGFPRERVIGMAGVLDTARYRAFLAASARRLRARHPGDGARRPRRHDGAARLVHVGERDPGDAAAGSGAPRRHRHPHPQRRRRDRASISRRGRPTTPRRRPRCEMVEAIVHDEKRVLPCAAWLEGEYGMSGLFLGVPCKLGARGLERIYRGGADGRRACRSRRRAPKPCASRWRPSSSSDASTSAVGLWQFYRSTIGKKIIMAATGLIFVAFVVVHMLGNLLLFQGPDRINATAGSCTARVSCCGSCASCCSSRSSCTSMPRSSSRARARQARPTGYDERRAAGLDGRRAHDPVGRGAAPRLHRVPPAALHHRDVAADLSARAMCTPTSSPAFTSGRSLCSISSPWPRWDCTCTTARGARSARWGSRGPRPTRCSRPIVTVVAIVIAVGLRARSDRRPGRAG